MKLIDRPESCIDFNSNYEILYNFDNFPIFMGITEQKPKFDQFETMEWIINKKSSPHCSITPMYGAKIPRIKSRSITKAILST